jgi:uncharacterized protein YjbI with pentapeptide repeats
MGKAVRNWCVWLGKTVWRWFEQLAARHPAMPYLAVLLPALLVILGLSWELLATREFRENILVESFGLLYDLLVIGALVAFINSLGERRRVIKRYEDEIDDFRNWKSEEATYRIAGNVKRLNEEKVTEVDLSSAFLQGARLGGAHLQRAELCASNLQGACLSNADLQQADLSWADLQQADLCSAHLERADLSESDLEQANLVHAHLERADLSWADLQGAILIDADLQGAILAGAQLQRANLTGCRLERAILWKADLHGADLSGATLNGAMLWGANLQCTDLSGADLQGARYDVHTRWPAGFVPPADAILQETSDSDLLDLSTAPPPDPMQLYLQNRAQTSPGLLCNVLGGNPHYEQTNV